MGSREPGTWRDNAGRVWVVALTFGDLAELKRVGLDLSGALRGPEAFARAIDAEPEKLFAAMWLASEQQAAKAGVTREQFERLIDPRALGEGFEALFEAAVDFFPRAAVAKVLRSKTQAAWAEVDRLIIESITGGSSASASGSPG